MMPSGRGEIASRPETNYLHNIHSPIQGFKVSESGSRNLPVLTDENQVIADKLPDLTPIVTH